MHHPNLGGRDGGVKWSDSSGKAINVLNPYFMTKLNIHAQSTQNPFANISSRIYFSYLLIVITEQRESEEEEGEKRQGRNRGGEGGVTKILHHFVAHFKLI